MLLRCLCYYESYYLKPSSIHQIQHLKKDRHHLDEGQMQYCVKITYHRGVRLIYERDGRESRGHHESENVQCEHDYHQKVILACDLHGFVRVYANVDRGCVNDVYDYVRDGHDYDRYMSEAF